MLDAFHSLISPALSIIQILPEADKAILIARPKLVTSCCPACGGESGHVHSHYTRRLSDLPWHGRAVEVRLQARRFRCGNTQCPRRIFTERLPDIVRPKARRTVRLGQSQLAIGFAVGGEPGFRLSRKLAMPVSGDTLLRMICAAEFEPSKVPRVVGIDDWARRKDSAMARLSAAWNAVAFLNSCLIAMPTPSQPGLNAIPASRLSPAIAPVFTPKALGVALQRQRKSQIVGISSTASARRCVLP